ncbi:MAG: hypothetical protein RSE55_09470 [Lachnospiraceae bacterium]
MDILNGAKEVVFGLLRFTLWILLNGLQLALGAIKLFLLLFVLVFRVFLVFAKSAAGN